MADRVVRYVFKGDTVGLRASLIGAGAGVKDLGTKLTATSKETEKFHSGLKTVGDAAGRMGLVAGLGVAVVVKKFADFDSAMSKVAASSGATGGQLDRLRGLALKLGAASQFSAKEAADGITELSKAGVKTSDIMGGALKGSLDLAAAGQISVADAANITATTLNQFGLQGNKATHVADLLAASAGKAQGDVGDMGTALKYVGPVAAQMGVSLEQTTGTIAELASQGILADQAGTSLRGMLSALTSPSKQAAEVMHSLGINVYDAQGKFVGFQGVAGQLHKALGNLSNADRDEALGRIFGNEQITAARILYKGGAGAVADWTNKVNDSGYASKQAAQLTDNLKGDIERLGGALDSLLISGGSSSNGPLRGLIQGSTGAVNALNALPGPIKSVSTGLLALTALAGGGLFLGSRTISGVRTMRQGLADVKEGAEKARVKLVEMDRATALRGIGRAGAVLGGLALAQSDFADKTHLSNTAAGALMGTIAGPWGAAIGGGIGLVKDLSSATHASAATQGELRAAAQDVISTLDQQTGALTANTTVAARKVLADKGIYDAAQRLGVSLKDLTSAYLGNGDAARRVGTQSLAGFNKRIKEGGAAANGAQKDAELLTSAITTQGGAMDSARRHIIQQSQASKDSASSTDTAAAASARHAKTLQDEAKRIQDVIDKTEALNSANLDARATFRSFQAAVDDARKSLKDNGKTLDAHTAKGRANAEALDNIASSAAAHAESMRKDGKSIDRVNGFLQQSRKDLINAAEHFGMTRKEANRYADQVLKIPKTTTTTPKFDDQQSRAKIRDYVNYVNNQLHGGIHDETVKLVMSAQANHIRGELSALKFASGGPVWGAGSETSDSINARLSNNEHVLTAAEVKAFGKGDARRGHRIVELWRQAALHGALPDPRDLPKFATGGPVLRVSADRTGSVTAGAQAYFDAITRQLSAQMSAAASKAFKQLGATGGGRPLGPAGTLSAGQILAGQRFARAQDGKPYIWGGVGPGGYDCSGYQSAILNAAQGRNPYQRIGSTSSMPWPGSRPGVGRYTIGWFKGFGGGGRGSSPGHTSGNIGGLGVESTGTHVRIGKAARSPMNGMFSGHMHYASGGAVEVPAILKSDEFVMSGDAVRRHGLAKLNAMNAPRFHNGGPVGFARGGAVSDTIIRVGRALGASRRDIEIALMAAAQESGLRNLHHGDRDSLGVFQQRAAWGSRAARLNVAQSARMFFLGGHGGQDGLFDKHNRSRLSMGQAAQAVQRSAFPGAYSKWADLARKLTDKKGIDDRTKAQKRRDTAREKALKHHLSLIDKAASKVADQLTKVSDKLKATRGARNALAGQVSQAFVSDPFTGTLGGFDSQMRYESKRLRGANTDLARLRKSGIGHGLLSQLASSGNVALIHQFAQLSHSDLARRQAAFNQRNRLDRAAGATVADAVYGKQIAGLSREVHHLTRELHTLRTSGKHIGNQINNFHGVNNPDAIARKTRRGRRAATRVVRHG